MKFAGAYVDKDTHEALKALAKREHRTLADQCRHLFERALKGEIQVSPPTGSKKGEKR